MSSRDKPVLVMVPGLGATGAVYEPFLKFFRDEYDVVTAEPPQVLPDKPTWETFLKPVEDTVAGREVYMIGHSLGGAIALKYTATHPKQVRKLVVVAPVAFRRRKDRLYTGLSKFMWYRRLHSAMMAIWNGHLLHLLKITKIRKETLGDGKRTKLYEWIYTIDLTRDIPKLQHTTVLWPKHEELIDPRTYQRFREEFPNVKTMEVPGSHNNLALAPVKLISPIRKELRD